MILEIPYWTSHHNMLIYAYYYYCEKEGIKFKLQTNSEIHPNGALLHIYSKTLFFDYSDDTQFVDNPENYNFYFKRSLLAQDKMSNVFPLNLQVNYSYKALKLLSQMRWSDLADKKNRIETARALDYFNVLTSLSHNAMDVRKLPQKTVDHDGRILFHTRLWNPDNNSNAEEKERRRLQNEFRIQACRIIGKNFKNASVGLYADQFSAKAAPDVLLHPEKTSKRAYVTFLKNCDIGIADDGLKDTPGWKIGEYALFGKAIISTPIPIAVTDFKENVNYLKLSGRSNFDEIPNKIEALLKDRKYLEMGQNNLLWSQTYVHPKSYLPRIMDIVGKKI